LKGLANYLLISTIIAASAGEIVAIIDWFWPFSGATYGPYSDGGHRLAIAFIHYPHRRAWQRLADYILERNGASK